MSVASQSDNSTNVAFFWFYGLIKNQKNSKCLNLQKETDLSCYHTLVRSIQVSQEMYPDMTDEIWSNLWHF